MNEENKICCVKNCGRTDNKGGIIDGKRYCAKHYQHIRLYGKILDKTIFDRNEIVVYEDYAEIILYNVKKEEVARTKIDKDKVDVVKCYKWCISKGYVQTTIDKKNVKLHRFISNPQDGVVVDHINGDKLDNRIENLRICTQQQNIFNSKKKATNKSGVTGVCWDKRSGKWSSQIMVNYKKIHLGYFDDFNQAVKVRKEAEEKYFGEFQNKC